MPRNNNSSASKSNFSNDTSSTNRNDTSASHDSLQSLLLRAEERHAADAVARVRSELSRVAPSPSASNTELSCILNVALRITEELNEKLQAEEAGRRQ